MDLRTLNLVQLKALAYDEQVRIEVSQNNLRVINREISDRVKQESALKDNPKSDTDEKGETK